MKVKELIEFLQGVDQEASVTLYDGDQSLFVTSVTEGLGKVDEVGILHVWYPSQVADPDNPCYTKVLEISE